ncbi:tRNA lysidine(34) synthetase TilS [Oenococcus sicerae]|uniref:tRNA(Ile)-lysidine synthase n=1 Tax=Oenococcus sicerae TaxID=2203724 RepID=A0ABX5QLY6_9LACO|nr:tRNA lysidine(34) synthetase TilS [Oenococcus sicerae]QAS69761.1 tRNA lysidine(34) synthetase TilS [Oenococcus sicerae]
MKSLYRQFQLNIQGKKLFSSDENILLAISGGVDSTVLADLLYRYEKGATKHLFLAHVDHQLRPDSAEETKLIDRQFASLGLQVFHTKWPLADQPVSGIENAARQFRYDFYQQVADKIAAKKIILAQHANDQAETVLLKIIRGGDWETVSSMAWSRPLAQDSAIQIIRPLLNIKKTDIYDYARARKLHWIEDPTNQDPDYTSRNQIRQIVLPALEKINPRAVENISAFADQMRDLQDDQLLEMLKIWIHRSAGLIPIKRSQLKEFELLLDNEKQAHGRINLANGFSLIKEKKEIKIIKER